VKARDKFGREHDKTCKMALQSSLPAGRRLNWVLKYKTRSQDPTARLLRTGCLPESWIADEEIQSLRSLISRMLGRSVTKAKNRIHGLLAINGVDAYSDLFGRMGIYFLEGRVQYRIEAQRTCLRK